MPGNPQPLASQTEPGTPKVDFPTPDTRDKILTDNLDLKGLTDYVALLHGAPNPDPANNPGQRLVKTTPIDWQFVQRIYARDRVDQDVYNANQTFDYEDNAFPIYTRDYVELRVSYAPLSKRSKLTGVVGAKVTNGGGGYTQNSVNITVSGGGGSGASFMPLVNKLGVIDYIAVTSEGTGYTSAPTLAISGGTSAATATALIQHPDAKLVAEQLVRMQDSPLDSLYVLVRRQYRLLPGAITSDRKNVANVIEERVTQTVDSDTVPGEFQDDTIDGGTTVISERKYTLYTNPDGSAANTPIYAREYYDDKLYLWRIRFWQLQRILNVRIISVSLASPGVITTEFPHGLISGDKVNIAGVAGAGATVVNGDGRTVTKLTATTFTAGVNTTGASTANTGWIRGPIPTVVAVGSIYGNAHRRTQNSATIESAQAYVVYSELKDIEGSANKAAIWEVFCQPNASVDYPVGNWVAPGIFTPGAGTLIFTITDIDLLAELLPGLTGWDSTFYVNLFGAPQQGYDYAYAPPRAQRFKFMRTRTYQHLEFDAVDLLPTFDVTSPGAGSNSYKMIQDKTIHDGWQWLSGDVVVDLDDSTITAVNSLRSIERVEESTYPVGSNITRPSEDHIYEPGDIVVYSDSQEPIEGSDWWCRTTILVCEVQENLP